MGCHCSIRGPLVHNCLILELLQFLTVLIAFHAAERLVIATPSTLCVLFALLQLRLLQEEIRREEEALSELHRASTRQRAAQEEAAKVSYYYQRQEARERAMEQVSGSVCWDEEGQTSREWELDCVTAGALSYPAA